MFAYRVFMAAVSAMVVASTSNVNAQSLDDTGKARSTTACTNNNQGGCVIAKVRPVKIVFQMHNPSSKVAWCKNDCLGTLRKNSIKFWSGQSDKF